MPSPADVGLNSVKTPVGVKTLDRWAYGAGMEYEERQRRLDRAWIAIRFELFIGFMAPAVVAFVIISLPNVVWGMHGGNPQPQWLNLLKVGLPLIGVAGVVFGLAWLVRLSRPNPERDQGNWRYRNF